MTNPLPYATLSVIMGSDEKQKEKKGGALNWVLSVVVGLVFAYILAAACAFVAIKLLPDLFREMNDQNKTFLKILTALFVLYGGRCAYLVVRK